MDILLGKVTQQAMNYAIRSGVTITTGYALNQCGRLLKKAPRSRDREELARLQRRLESKIRIISPAIDMIELISARGNTSLESAVQLTKEIRYDIQTLGVRLNRAANDEELLQRQSTRAKSRAENEQQLKSIITDIRALLDRIEDAVPLINLAITTSGVNLSTKLSGTVSPSRLLQASTFLTAADTQYLTSASTRQQVGPTYVVSLYMLFAGHAWRPVDESGVRDTTWKEVIHKAHLKLMRLPLDQLYDLPGEQTGSGATSSFRESTTSAEFAYQLVLIEDLDDDRVHTFEANEPQPGPFDGVPNAGIRDVVPVHEVSKLFYADTGKILNIGGDGETNNPVLLLRRDVHAEAPRRMLQRSRSVDRSYFEDERFDEGDISEIDAQIHRESTPNTPLEKETESTSMAHAVWRLPPDLDPEWMALEVFVEDPDSDDDADDLQDSNLPSSRPTSSRQQSLEPGFAGALSKLSLRSNSSTSSPANNQLVPTHQSTLDLSPNKVAKPAVKTSLSLLEMLLKLAALQQFRQDSHLSIEDELLNFFLEDSATAGAGADMSHRRRIRREAVQRVGFDPYDESPIKRRNEEYIKRAQMPAGPDFQPHLAHEDEGYGYEEPVYQSVENVLSSPSPSMRPPYHQRTPSRSSTLASARAGTPSSSMRKPNGGALNGSSSSGRPLATPPSTAGSRAMGGRVQSEPKLKSPLGREVSGESTLSPGE